MKKETTVTVQISKYHPKGEVTLVVPFKERVRMLIFGKLHIRVSQEDYYSFVLHNRREERR